MTQDEPKDVMYPLSVGTFSDCDDLEERDGMTPNERKALRDTVARIMAGDDNSRPRHVYIPATTLALLLDFVWLECEVEKRNQAATLKEISDD